jgi:Tfp pilus assembly protein PilV
MPAPEGPRRRRRAGAAPDDGFSIVELLVSTTILMLIVVAMTTMLVDSLSSAVLTKTRLTAASLASNAIENAKAIGQGGLTATPANPTTCATAFTGSQVSGVYGSCSYTTVVDSVTYTVMPTVTVPVTAGQPDTVSVAVTWSSGTHVFVTTSQIGGLSAGSAT